MITVVIPVYNEQESLLPLYGEIRAAADAHGLNLEVVFIDDGSKDGSWKVVRDIARQHPEVRAVRFRRNFGKAAALSAGFRAARGDVVLTLDADLQDDPAEIPRFLAALEHGSAGGEPAPPAPDRDPEGEGVLDVVSGWKKVRHDPWHKVYPSRVFNGMVSWLTGVPLHDHNCGMKAYRRAVVREVRLYGEFHRFVPVLAHARGFRVGELVIRHRPRRYGSSKYGVIRFLKGFLDLFTVKFLTSYSRRPQHVLGSFGLVSFVLGGLGLAYLGATWVLHRVWPIAGYVALNERPLLLYSLGALLVGAQAMSVGLLAELITAYQVREEDTYSVRETLGPADPAP